MISVVLPSYNGEKYIRESINSVLDQTYTDIELILVDDCSCDSTWSIMQEYKERDSRIKTVHNETNQKLPRSLNIGFSYASGDCYTWISDDNMYKPNALMEMYKHISLHPETDIVYANYDLIDENGIIIEQQDEKRNVPQENFLHNKVGACFLYRKEVDKKLNGYDESLFLVEDYDFWLRASRYFKLEPLSSSLYLYRIHDRSLSENRKNEILKKTIELDEREYNIGFISEKYIAGTLKRIVDYYFCTENPEKFNHYLKCLKQYNYPNINKSYLLAEKIGLTNVRKILKLFHRA